MTILKPHPSIARISLANNKKFTAEMSLVVDMYSSLLVTSVFDVEQSANFFSDLQFVSLCVSKICAHRRVAEQSLAQSLLLHAPDAARRFAYVESSEPLLMPGMPMPAFPDLLDMAGIRGYISSISGFFPEFPALTQLIRGLDSYLRGAVFSCSSSFEGQSAKADFVQRYARFVSPALIRHVNRVCDPSSSAYKLTPAEQSRLNDRFLVNI